MTEEEYAVARRWVETWKRAGPELERIRMEEIRKTDVRSFIDAMDDIIEYVLRVFPPRLESGLVEQQRLFQLLRSDA